MPKRGDCRLCGSLDVTCFLSFGPMPLAGNFIKKGDIGKEKVYPLDVYFCNNCASVQILDVIPKEDLFRDYRYLSSVTKTLTDHFREYASDIKQIKNSGFVLEIGCNDGVLLHPLKESGFNVLGIEPATNVAKIAQDRGIDVINDFFGKKVSNSVIDKYGKCDVVTANNVYAHIDDMNDVTEGIVNVLKDDGIFVFQVHHLAKLIEEFQYDMIYHEHMMYHSVITLDIFLKKHGMTIFDVKKIPLHGGSIRVYAQKSGGSMEINESVEDIINEEKSIGLDKYSAYESFSKKVTNHKEDMLKLLKGIKSKGKTIAGYGMSGRANTMLNFWKVSSDILEYGIDASPERYDRFIPVMKIPIHPPEKLGDVDYILILAWTYEKEIREKESKFAKRGGKFILPFPKPHISN